MAMYYNAATNVGGYQLSDALRTVYSSLIMFAAQPVERFVQFSEIREELGVSPGLTMQFLKYNSLGDAQDLTELTSMAVEALVTSTVSITVAEVGHAVGVTELLLQSAFTDVMADASHALGLSFARKEDSDLRNTVLGVTNVKYGGQKGSRGAIVAADAMSTTLVKDQSECLSSLNVPKVGGEFFVDFIHPHQARDLRDDDHWVSAQEYAGSRAIFLGECGMYEDVIFIETTQMPVLTGSGSGADDVYQSVLIGDLLYGYAISLPVEMRDNGVEDFGRKHSLCYYTIYGSGLLNSSFGCRGETS